MDISRLPEPLRARLEERAAMAPIDKVKKILHGIVSDASDFDEIRFELRAIAAQTTFGLRDYLAAFESVLAEPHPEGELARLVERDANWVLDEFSDRAAAEFLQSLATMLRETIAEAESPRT